MAGSTHNEDAKMLRETEHDDDHDTVREAAQIVEDNEVASDCDTVQQSFGEDSDYFDKLHDIDYDDELYDHNKDLDIEWNGAYESSGVIIEVSENAMVEHHTIHREE